MCTTYFPVTGSMKPSTDKQLHQGAALGGCSDDVFEDIQNFLWGNTDDNLDEGELIKATITRSLEEDIHPEDDIKFMESLLKFQEQVKCQETCEVLVLRKRLQQTCLLMHWRNQASTTSKSLLFALAGRKQTILGDRRENFSGYYLRQ